MPWGVWILRSIRRQQHPTNISWTVPSTVIHKRHILSCLEMASLVGRRLRKVSQRKETNTKDNHVQRNLLERLPLELISLVCLYLPEIDVACLALCCRLLLLKVGSDSFLFAHKKRYRDWDQFLSRISQDIPSYYLCYSCRMLHLWEKVKGPQWKYCQKYAQCIQDVLDEGINTNKKVKSSYCFEFVHLQLTMRAYRCGPSYGITADSLSHLEVL